MAHEIDQAAAPGDLQALSAVGREQHVARPQGHRRGDGDGFLSGALDVERNATLPLHAQHPVVVQACEKHVSQADLKIVVVQMRIPGADGGVVVVQNAYHLESEAALYVSEPGSDVGPGHCACRGDVDVAEVWFLPRPSRGVRYVQPGFVAHCLRPPGLLSVCMMGCDVMIGCRPSPSAMLCAAPALPRISASRLTA